MENEENKLLCDICNKPKKNHIDFIDNDSEIYNDNEDIKDESDSKNISLASNKSFNLNNKSKECIICFEKKIQKAFQILIIVHICFAMIAGLIIY